MTKQAPKFNENFDKNFWQKNAKVVEIDTCEIVDRLFYCSLTCHLPFQVSKYIFWQLIILCTYILQRFHNLIKKINFLGCLYSNRS